MNRWIANKFGLLNFWYYDQEEFDLADGKLLFRGSNGSGKSVTMQSFVPLLLDGNKSPERLDPFGSRARKIENYLLDEEHNERTAYLYIEFKRQDQEHYLTIGMGLKAVKNAPLDSWYFIVTDGRRIGKDLMLYRQMGEKLPLTKKQLENEMKKGGFFTTSQGEYMRMVNDQLFGFESVENYEELLNLLINVRSPKLSKDFKPTEIYKILSQSLKVLSEDDLRPMSEAMENMDSYQNHLASYQRTQNACKNIKYHYDAYNKYQLLQKAKNVANQQEQLIAARKKQKELQIKIKELQENQENKKVEREEKVTLQQQAKLQYKQLSNRQEVHIKEELVELEKSIESTVQFLEAKDKQIEGKKEQQVEKELQKKRQREAYELQENKLKEKLEALEVEAEACFFEEGTFLTKEVMTDPLAYPFDYIEETTKQYLNRIQALQKEVIVYEDAKEKEAVALQEKEMKEIAYEQMKSEAQEANRLLLQAKEDYKVYFVDWQKQAQHMLVTNEARIELFTQVAALEKDSDVLQISQYLQPFYNQVYRDYQIQLERKEAEKKQYEKQISSLEEEIEGLKNTKEIEPERSQAVRQNRKRLEQADIAHQPLYKVIDFKKGVTASVRRQIESALVSMGLIDALVVNRQDLPSALIFNEGDADKYITTTHYEEGISLSQYLEVDQAQLAGVEVKTVEHILNSICLKEDQVAYINDKGEYGLGILRGKADATYQVQYIGASARAWHRERLISEKEEAVGAIKSLVQALILEKENDVQRLKRLEQEYAQLPKVEDLREMLILRQDKEREADRLQAIYLQQDQIYFDCNQRCQQLKVALYNEMQGIQIPATKSRFEEAIEAARNYQLGIAELRAIQSNLISYKELLLSIEGVLEELEIDIDNLMAERSHRWQEVKQQREKKVSLEEVLKKTNIEEIEEQLSWCLKIEANTPILLQQIDRELGTLSNSIEVKQDALGKMESNCHEIELQLQKYSDIFKEEYALGYVLPVEEEAMQSYKKVLEKIKIETIKDSESYMVAVMEAINRNNSDLRDYGIKVNKEKDRIHIKARMDGKDIDFYEFSEIINHYIEDTRLLISEEERRVFEEVLLNTISSKITSKIYLSKQWIDKINRLMESMKTSSSLKLSLKWVPRKAEQEGQLDIGELLKLLELGDRCSAEDMKKITDHFGAKVKEGIRACEETGGNRNYHTIIQEVLDYRKWYEFKLFFEKKNERKKELTNNDFFRFSGGEKAMSMYIPLFSAVYARYENAKKDCPRMIAMDEAFAGVDEANIRDMFRLLDELDLDFVINSQVLWGDYDTVKALAISEIIREENDTTVVVLRYHWNGMQKVLL